MKAPKSAIFLILLFVSAPVFGQSVNALDSGAAQWQSLDTNASSSADKVNTKGSTNVPLKTRTDVPRYEVGGCLGIGEVLKDRMPLSVKL